MTIVYSSISRGATILCSHQLREGDFHSIAQTILPNIPTANDTKTTYTAQNYLYHCIVENGIIYLCTADADFGTRQPYAYLTEIQRQFLSGSLGSRAQFADTGELNQDFSPVMAIQMETFSRGETGDRLSTLQSQVDGVTEIMTQNIEKVMQRGEGLDDLMDKTTELEASASTFQKSARSAHRAMFWKNKKMTIILVGVVLLIIIIIILIILFATGTI